MTLACTSRYGGHGTHCQDRQHPGGLHHGHTDDQCLQWADGGVHFAKPISSCPWPPAHEVARRADELAAKIDARRERILAAAVENPNNPVLRVAVEKLRGDEARAIPVPGPCPVGDCAWDADGPLDEHLYEHDYNELRPAVARLADENNRLRTELAKSRRDALFAASEIAESVATETTAQKATQATIIAKLRVAAMANDECAKCGHRRADHQHHGGICKTRRSTTTRCACRQYGFAAVTATPKES